MRNEKIEKWMPTYILLKITASSAVSFHLVFLPFMTDYRYQENSHPENSHPENSHLEYSHPYF